jgi:hypothetical protein
MLGSRDVHAKDDARCREFDVIRSLEPADDQRFVASVFWNITLAAGASLPTLTVFGR